MLAPLDRELVQRTQSASAWEELVRKLDEQRESRHREPNSCRQTANSWGRNLVQWTCSSAIEIGVAAACFLVALNWMS